MKTSEERLESKYIRHLKKEMSKLKRENQQLRKKIRQQEYDSIETDLDTDSEPSIVEFQFKNIEEKVECPSCGGYDVLKFRSGNYTFYKCQCGSKGRLGKAS